jgi:hypothetical protein
MQEESTSMAIRYTEEWEIEKTGERNWQYPIQLSYDRHLVGVSNFNDGFQFIFSDGTRTEVDQSNCEDTFIDIELKQKDTPIARIVVQYDNYDEPFLCGLKLFDR